MYDEQPQFVRTVQTGAVLLRQLNGNGFVKQFERFFVQLIDRLTKQCTFWHTCDGFTQDGAGLDDPRNFDLQRDRVVLFCRSWSGATPEPRGGERTGIFVGKNNARTPFSKDARRGWLSQFRPIDRTLLNLFHHTKNSFLKNKSHPLNKKVTLMDKP